jgi:hypothetical protein
VRIFLSTVEGSKRWAKLAVEASAILLRAIGRPARVHARAACGVRATCKQLWALSRWVVGADTWARGGADTGKICIL